jgi:hypothetical protein
VEKNVKPIESRDEAIRRLAVQARAKHVKILTHAPSNEWFAESLSNSGSLHRITVLSCSCVGFFSHGRCMHHSALLDQLGLLPEDPEPTLSSTIAIITPAPAELPEVLSARSEVTRLSKSPKSTADWVRLQNAQARLNELTTPFVACAA